MTADSLIAVARRLNFIRETGGPNRGLWVEFVQRFTGNEPGDSWCASFVSLVLAIVYRGHPPLRPTASCAEMLAEATQKGFVVTTPRVGDLYFYVDASGHADHVGICTSVMPLTGLAGNTSETGASSNGDGVYEHPISAHTFVRLPEAPHG